MHTLGLFDFSDDLDRLSQTGILWRRLIVTLILRCSAPVLMRHCCGPIVRRAVACRWMR